MRLTFEGDPTDRGAFGALYVALITGPPVRDRMGLRTYFRLVEKLEAISEEKEIPAGPNAEGSAKGRWPKAGEHSVELDDQEAAFLAGSLDDLLGRCPRDWLRDVLAAYQRLDADPRDAGSGEPLTAAGES